MMVSKKSLTIICIILLLSTVMYCVFSVDKGAEVAKCQISIHKDKNMNELFEINLLACMRAKGFVFERDQTKQCWYETDHGTFQGRFLSSPCYHSYSIIDRLEEL